MRGLTGALALAVAAWSCSDSGATHSSAPHTFRFLLLAPVDGTPVGRGVATSIRVAVIDTPDDIVQVRLDFAVRYQTADGDSSSTYMVDTPSVVLGIPPDRGVLPATMVGSFTVPSVNPWNIPAGGRITEVRPYLITTTTSLSLTAPVTIAVYPVLEAMK